MPIQKVISLLFFILFSFQIKAQNFVANGGFEKYEACPVAIGNLVSDLKDLSAPTNGSTDYFNTCAKNEVGIPQNFKGEQEAIEGSGYAGLYFYSPNDYREYIQFKLKQPLHKGSTYKVAMQLSLAESSELAMQEITVLFTNELLSLDTNQNLSPSRLDRFKVDRFSYISLKVNRAIFDSAKWTYVEAEFEAKGHEKYLTVGNFKNNKNTRIIGLTDDEKNTKRMSYYYLDDVNLTPIEDTAFEMNTPFVLNQLQFEFDTAKLTQKARKEIEKVYHHLKKNSKIQLQIYGHTDDLGSETYNQYLSSRRARAVALYLQELGLKEKRIRWEGKGDKMPLFKGTSTKERDANRRVEFVITEFEDH